MINQKNVVLVTKQQTEIVFAKTYITKLNKKTYVY